MEPETASPDRPADPRAQEVTVTVCPSGPLLLRGPATLLDGDGQRLDPGRRTVALCRCGRSAEAPFCDGSHKRRTRRPPVDAPGA
ncbi:CDGSH iron-sulfur domain-containing protein [Kineococcus esterisolvens]|uniref:CDGSH iron-sulfur domain-containing protein n=1 Tax=unclassified Kineococcus TaxID=2621656 RepID=UPI003D7CA556